MNALAIAASLLLILIAVILVRGDAPSGTPRALAETPAGISFECLGCKATPQEIAETAQAHCRMFGKNAQRTHFIAEPSGDVRLAFSCL